MRVLMFGWEFPPHISGGLGTASYGLTNSTLAYIQNIADNGLANSLMGNDGLGKGVCSYNGFCTNESLANTFNIEHKKLHIFSTN